jgi:hypothetical protein
MCDNIVSQFFHTHRSAYYQGAPVTQQAVVTVNALFGAL